MSRAAGRIEIRPMLPEDAPAVAEVDRLCFTIPWNEATFAAECETTVGYYRVVAREGRIVGFLGSQIIDEEAHITTFGVHPDQRRQGLADRLLGDFLHEAVSRGCRRITLEVRESNTPAQRLYRKWGFSPVSRRKRYYSDNDEDALVMWIEDTSRLGFRELLRERLSALDPG